FQLWHSFRGGTIGRAELQELIAAVQSIMHARLVAGTRRYDAAEGLSHDLLAQWQALWTFVRVEGIEPTNNAAERALRPAVLWRKGCFGAQSAAGNTFVERILTVSATCGQQNRHLRTFLSEAVSSYWAGRPAPSLVPTP